MINNDKQYQVIKNQIAVFKKALDHFGEPKKTEPRIVFFQRKAVKSTLEDLIQEAKEYEARIG